MAKINIEANTYIYPNPVTLVGTEVEGRANFMALGWVSRVNAKPPFVGIGVNRLHFTAKGVQETKTFSINYPMLLTMPDNSYWRVGEYAGKAWSIGKKLKK